MQIDVTNNQKESPLIFQWREIETALGISYFSTECEITVPRQTFSGVRKVVQPYHLGNLVKK